jgi:hypothetical protein
MRDAGEVEEAAAGVQLAAIVERPVWVEVAHAGSGGFADAAAVVEVQIRGAGDVVERIAIGGDVKMPAD